MTDAAKPGSQQEQPQEEAQVEQTEAQVEESTSDAQESQAPEGENDLATRLAEVEAALAAAQEQASTEKDKALRVAAEAENVKRRSAQEVEKAKNFALEKFAGELLSVIDNLERAMQAIDNEDDAMKSVYEGIEMTYKGFIQTIEKFGMQPVNPEGEAFDPQLHQAMGMQESEDVAPNTVLAVMQKGYTLNGRLLRPAMVMVSRAPTEGVDTQA
ncbi:MULTISPECIES: nucleotide exchange factor GrpE [Gammaproteobacteria]|uniref:nucleotide exchange factor GrpE n=1 Tax=Gammaproteobacteria TaxID=1236 RepID=UPI000DD0CC2C|nr:MULTISPECIES: nucleotide exchange factor GrpE [Gammaproteobacteria]RTE86905.1 nucleotide exchange factor GrpE [Aliidiomarina sp. B3213]TCZ93305.1 nucleotide exchange factor GrpE [Lysobacter sp. N42]